MNRDCPCCPVGIMEKTDAAGVRTCAVCGFESWDGPSIPLSGFSRATAYARDEVGP